MVDRFHDDLENALSFYSNYGIDDYEEEEEDTDGEYEEDGVYHVEKEEKLDELACPFCQEDFDVLGLCCHIDADHRMEVKPRICPVCATKVGINMASHVITQHESLLKTLCNKKHRIARSRSAMYILRKELQEKHLLCIKESPYVPSSSDPVVDSTLLSFVNYKEPSYRPQIVEAAFSTESSLSGISSSAGISTRAQTPLTSDRNNEGTKRCEFVQGLVLSTIFEDL